MHVTTYLTKQRADDLMSGEELERALRREFQTLGHRRPQVERRLAELRTQIDEAEGIDVEPEEEVFERIAELEDEIEDIAWCLYDLVSRATRRRYSAYDVADWVTYARNLDAGAPAMGEETIADLLHFRRVPTAPLRQACLDLLDADADLTLEELTRRIYCETVALEDEHGCGFGSAKWLRDGKPNSTQLKRYLGIIPTVSNNNWRTIRTFIPYLPATAIARAFGLEPHECGL